MNKILVSIVLIISLMGCVAALDVNSKVEMRPGEAAFEQLYNHGIGQPWVGGNPPGQSGHDQASSDGYSSTYSATSATFSQYSQYYTMSKGNAPKVHIDAPKKHDIKGKTPSTVYFSYQMHAVPYSQYQTYATYTGGNSLWIQGSTSWTQYAAIPQGASLSILATSSNGGNGYLYEIMPGGQLTKNYYSFFPGYNQINFYADTVGQHILLFAIGDQVSNSIVINVIANQPPSYNQPPGYRQPNYPQQSNYQTPSYQPPGYQHQTYL
jgi:hypothetical protein